jgi:hypothetical protein
MKYAEWLETVPSEITNDPIWKLEVYRLALFASRHVLSAEVVKHRIGLSTHIIGMLTAMILHQRKYAIREEQAEYSTQPSDFWLDSEVPFP